MLANASSYNENKEKIKKHEELWIKIRDLIRSVTWLWWKIKSNFYHELPLNKAIEIATMTNFVRAAFHENNKY